MKELESNTSDTWVSRDYRGMSQLENRIQFLKNSNDMEHFQVLSVPELDVLVSRGGSNGDS